MTITSGHRYTKLSPRHEDLAHLTGRMLLLGCKWHRRERGRQARSGRRCRLGHAPGRDQRLAVALQPQFLHINVVVSLDICNGRGGAVAHLEALSLEARRGCDALQDLLLRLRAALLRL